MLEDGSVVTHLNATCPQRLSIISPSLIKAVIKAVFCRPMPYHSAVRSLLGLTHDMHVDYNLLFVSLLWCEPGAPRHPYHRDCGETGTEVQVFIYPDVGRNDVHWEAGRSYHFTPRLRVPVPTRMCRAIDIGLDIMFTRRGNSFLCMSSFQAHTGREGCLMVPLQVPAVSAKDGGVWKDTAAIGRLGAYMPGQQLGRWGYLVMDGFLVHGVSPNFSKEPRKVICLTYRREVREGGAVTDHQPEWSSREAGPKPRPSDRDSRTTEFHHILRKMYRGGRLDETDREGVEKIMDDMGCRRT